MAAVLRSPRLWIGVLLILPLLLALTLAAVLILSPTQRIRLLLPRLDWMRDHAIWPCADILADGIAGACRTEAGYRATIALLQHPDAQVRLAALRQAADPVGSSASRLDAEHLALLRATIDDPDPAIAGLGILILGYAGDRPSLDAIIARGRTTPSIAQEVLSTLGTLAPERVEMEAERWAHQVSPGVYQWALLSLGIYPSTSSLATLVAWHASDDPRRSQAALSALAAACRQLQRPEACPRVDRTAFLTLLQEAISDRRRDMVERQRLLLFVMDQEAAYRLGQGLLREVCDPQRTAELVIHALHSLERHWRPYLHLPLQVGTLLQPECLGWMGAAWPAFSAPRPGDPPLRDIVVLAAVRQAILDSERATAANAITLALTRQLGSLEDWDRDDVQDLLRELAKPDPSFGCCY